MKEMKIIHAADIPAEFGKAGVGYQKISYVNWPAEFPYLPDVRFAIAHNGDSLLLHYVVREKSTRAVALDDCGKVWEDSCVEFFFAPDNNGYYNIECNCIGTLVFGYGAGRENRIAAPKGVFDGIDRWTTLPHKTIEETHVDEWEAALVIPASSFFRHGIKSFDGLKFSANFYKCGDALSTVHFISWAPISTPSPDFHRPEFFKTMEF